MKNPAIIQIIKERFQEQKMNTKYQLQLNKIVEMEDKFTKEFSKEKWKEYKVEGIFRFIFGNWLFTRY